MVRRRGGVGVTLQAVAERAGTSTMTVSNVLNGTGKMSDATRLRVREAINALGYKPNAAARALASAGAARIGLIYANPQNAFLSAMLVGALHAAAARGAQLMIQHSGEPDYEALAESLRTLVRSGANALLLPPSYSEFVTGQPVVAELGVPIAAIAPGRALPDMITVRIDDRAAARSVTDLLADQGHRRIGFIAGPDGHSSTAARREGYLDSLIAHGISIDPSLIATGAFTFESALGAAERLLENAEPPSAIFASSDDMAAAVVSVAHRRGLHIPGKLAVAGFDDTPIAMTTWPTLTTVHQPITEMAEQATLALITELGGTKDNVGGVDRIVEFAVIERGSTR